ncbi:hypothetical protein L596_018894 [Steinernema carpocapsae]|uniref:BTB domain-containing protein n=1 Tax=Steinernema carpocapsae TaxID=34508 RepID=A0A4U5N6J3_STECR|nr:hypothetical protein L596_018894 [Steinernema carpocapsae]
MKRYSPVSPRPSSRRASSKKATNDVVRYRMPESSRHFAQVGAYLAKARVEKDFHTADIQVLLEGNEKDYIHSAVGFVHSTVIRNELEKGKRTPFVIDLSKCRATSVKKVIDWMYHGTVDLGSSNITAHLEVTDRLGVSILHNWLEDRLVKMASSKEHMVYSINVVTDPRCVHVSPDTRKRVLAVFSQNCRNLSKNVVSRLSSHAVTALVSYDGASLGEKISEVNLALMWIRGNLNFAAEITKKVRVPNMIDADKSGFREALREAVQGPYGEYACVCADQYGHISVCTDKDSYKRCFAGSRSDLSSGSSCSSAEGYSQKRVPSRRRSFSEVKTGKTSQFTPINVSVGINEMFQRVQKSPMSSCGRSRSSSLVSSIPSGIHSFIARDPFIHSQYVNMKLQAHDCNNNSITPSGFAHYPQQMKNNRIEEEQKGDGFSLEMAAQLADILDKENRRGKFKPLLCMM